MLSNLSKQAKSQAQTASTIVKNVAELVDALCLAIVSGFAIYQARYNHSLKQLWAYVLLFAGLVIALQAFVLLVRHFNHK